MLVWNTSITATSQSNKTRDAIFYVENKFFFSVYFISFYFRGIHVHVAFILFFRDRSLGRTTIAMTVEMYI